MNTTYSYKDASGHLLKQKVVQDGREEWRRPDGKGGWIYNQNDVPHVLYGLPAVKAAEAVWIAPDEQAVNDIMGIGKIAVCGEERAKWRPEYAEQLKGKAVAVLSGTNPTWKAFAVEAANALHGVATGVKLLELSEVWEAMPEDAGIREFKEEMKSTTDALLVYLYHNTPEWKPMEVAAEDSPTWKATNNPGLVKASDIPYEPPRWLIAPYIQKGKGTLVQGDNGTGKTAFLCAIAAHISTGRPFMGIEITTPGNVLILSVEDDLPVLRGRIEADGGDLDKCHFMTNAAGLTFNSPEVEAAIKEIQARLVIFDPFQAFLGAGVDMFKANETRPELAKLFEICDRYDCACAIIAHTSKSSDTKTPVNRSLGSADIPAAMRSIIHIIKNLENPDECIAVHVKCSNAPRGQSIAYRIGDRGGVEWVGFHPMTAEDLTAVIKRKEKGIPYDKEPLVQVFKQLVTDRPGGGFWSYSSLKNEGAKILGFPPFDDLNDLRTRLDSGLARELQTRDGLIVIHSAQGKGNARGVRIESYKLPQGYQTKIKEG